MTRGAAWTASLAVGLAAGLALTGCGDSHSGQGHHNGGQAHPGPIATSRNVSPLPTASSPPPTRVAGNRSLPSNCDGVLTLAELERIVGRPIGGTPQYTKGLPEPNIERTGRVTCRYGDSASPAATPTETATTPDLEQSVSASPTATPSSPVASVPVEAGLSAYKDAESASRRVDYTVRQQQAAGATATDITVAGKPGVLLTTPTDSILVVSDRNVTLMLSIDPTVTRGDQLTTVASGIAEAVLNQPG